MFSAKTAGYTIGQINRSPRLMAESHRICQEKFGYDGCVIDVDDATLAEACGAKVKWRDDDVASVDEHHPALEDLRDIDTLHMPDPCHAQVGEITLQGRVLPVGGIKEKILAGVTRGLRHGVAPGNAKAQVQL